MTIPPSKLKTRNTGHDIFTPWNIEIDFGVNEKSSFAHRAYRYALSNVASATVTADGMGSGYIDPRSKRPAVSENMRSVTVLSSDASTATAYALATYARGSKHGMKFVEGRDEVMAIVVDLDGNLIASKDLVTELMNDGQPIVNFDGGPNDLRQKQREEANEL